MEQPNQQLIPARRAREVEPSLAPAPRRPGYADYGYEQRSEEDLASGTLRDYVHTLLRRKWFILAVAAAGLLVGLAFVIPKPLPYIARTSVEIQGLNETFMRMNEVDPQAGSGMSGTNSANILTQVRILNSSSLRRRVVDKLERELIPTLPPQGSGTAALVNRIRTALGFNTAEPSRALREALQGASSSVAAKAVPDTRVVEIVCQSPHPEVAAEFLNTLVNEFVDQGIEARSKASQRTSRWLASQLEEQKSKLEQAESQLRDFVSRSGVAGLTQEDSKNTLAQSKVQELQAQLAGIQADRIAKQTRYEIANSRGVDSVPEVQGSLLPHLSALADLRRQKADLLTTLTPKHYKVRRLQAQIDEAEAALQKEKAEVLQRMRSDYEAALKREKLLAGAYAGQSGALLSQADKSTQYGLLRREVDSNRQIYNTMVQQVNQAGIASAVPINNIRVIDPASPGFEPSYEHVYIGGGIGLSTGLLLGCILAVLLHQMDRRVRAPGQAFGVLQIPELGVIPSEGVTDRKPLRIRVGRKHSEGNGNGSGVDGDANRIELITHQHKPSPVAESFRATLMSILFSVEARKNSVWSVTSPSPKEGKSTVTSNLAIALAELKRRVLVIDADMRKPRVHDIFDVPNTWGLSDLLQESTAISQYPEQSLYRSTTIPNLFVLPSGPAVSVVNTLLCSDRLKQLIERLRGQFDTVLIDTPPMMVLPDARIVGQSVDAVILVFRAGLTSVDDARAASRRLIEDGTRILGTVLNDWRPVSLGRKYYHYYDSYYSKT